MYDFDRIAASTREVYREVAHPRLALRGGRVGGSA
jgi:hypothetical protein